MALSDLNATIFQWTCSRPTRSEISANAPSTWVMDAIAIYSPFRFCERLEVYNTNAENLPEVSPSSASFEINHAIFELAFVVLDFATILIWEGPLYNVQREITTTQWIALGALGTKLTKPEKGVRHSFMQ